MTLGPVKSPWKPGPEIQSLQMITAPGAIVGRTATTDRVVEVLHG